MTNSPDVAKLHSHCARVAFAAQSERSIRQRVDVCNERTHRETTTNIDAHDTDSRGVVLSIHESAVSPSPSHSIDRRGIPENSASSSRVRECRETGEDCEGFVWRAELARLSLDFITAPIASITDSRARRQSAAAAGRLYKAQDGACSNDASQGSLCTGAGGLAE